MSDLSLQSQQATSPLPVSSYFDPVLFERERQTIFRHGPRYVGHELAVPHVGDYCALEQESSGRALVRTAQGVQLLSNVCRHRQAVMLKGRGNLQNAQSGSAGGNVVCPLHRWTYSGGQDSEPLGRLLGAPHFAHDPCLHLDTYKLRSYNGLLFEDNGRDVAADLLPLGAQQALSFEGMVLGHVQLHTCHYNWKTFIEVYLEDYHVKPFHPGLGHFVTCDDLRWEFGPEYSLQTVGVADLSAPAATAAYQRWQHALMQYRGGELPEQGAIWLTYYPHIMVEWYPHTLVISTLHPLSARQTLNVVEFYYPQEIAAFERELVQAQQAAYMQTCAEDDEIAERMEAGRQALLARGEDDAGPYQAPMEDGMRHFHAWYRDRMSDVRAVGGGI